MTEEKKGKPSIEEEVMGLKRQLRRHQLFSLATSIFLTALVIITFFRRDYPQLRTGTLHIMGENGAVITLESSPSGGGALVTRDEAGRPLVEISRTPTAGTVTTFHQGGAVLIELGNTPTGGSLTTFSNEEKPLVRLSKTGYGGDLSLFSEEDRQPSVSLTTLGEGGAQVLHRKSDNLLR